MQLFYFRNKLNVHRLVCHISIHVHPFIRFRSFRRRKIYRPDQPPKKPHRWKTHAELGYTGCRRDIQEWKKLSLSLVPKIESIKIVPSNKKDWHREKKEMLYNLLMMTLQDQRNIWLQTAGIAFISHASHLWNSKHNQNIKGDIRIGT